MRCVTVMPHTSRSRCRAPVAGLLLVIQDDGRGIPDHAQELAGTRDSVHGVARRVARR